MQYSIDENFTVARWFKVRVRNWLGDTYCTYAQDQEQEAPSLASCTEWTYDTSEFYDTAITENNWVCDKSHYTPDLFTLAVVGLILGTFVFSAVADFFGRKLSFYIGTATVIVFTLCMIPVSYDFHLFALFKVRIYKCFMMIYNCFFIGACSIWNASSISVPSEYSLWDFKH